jgi:hypothetical protein
VTRDEAVERIAEGLHFRVGREEFIKKRLEEARVHLEQGKSLPWWLKEEDAALTLSAGSNTIALPEGFIRVDTPDPLRYVDGEDSTQFIPWRGFAHAKKAYDGVEASGPSVAVLRENDIYIFPTADAEYDLLWSYYKHSDALDEDDIEDHPWLVNCPDAIIGEAGVRCAEDLEDTTAIAKFEKMRAKGFSSMLTEIAEREATEGPMQLGANN